VTVGGAVTHLGPILKPFLVAVFSRDRRLGGHGKDTTTCFGVSEQGLEKDQGPGSLSPKPTNISTDRERRRDEPLSLGIGEGNGGPRSVVPRQCPPWQEPPLRERRRPKTVSGAAGALCLVGARRENA
jgi:hypothetical protein